MKRLISILIVLTCAVSAFAATIHVDANGTGDYPTIQAAINDANDSDIIILSYGIYTGPGNRDIDFRGKAITVQSENGPENCIIDCNGTEIDPHRGFYFHNGEGSDSVLSGLTIINGRAPLFKYQAGSQTFNYWAGGAIFCYESSPAISNCRLERNCADWFGGAIACRRGAPIITGCAIMNNIANSGGGVYAIGYKTPILGRCVVSNNTARGGNIGLGLNRGGGVFSHGGTILINCLLLGNSAQAGGAFFVAGDNFTPGNTQILNCTITGNTAHWAGAVACGELSCPSIASSVVWGNDANNVAEIAMTSIDWGSRLFVSYSDIRGGKDGILGAPGLLWGPGNIDLDPCFADPCSGDYHLLPDSPCINTGDPNYIPEPNETDLDGLPRFMDGRIDMGTYEFQPPTPAELLLDLSDYIDWLNLPDGTANSLKAKLAAAVKNLNDNNGQNDKSAVNVLKAFTNEVEAQRGKEIPTADADELITATQDIIELMNGN